MSDWEQQCLNRFQVLAKHFLDSYNPRPDNAIIVLDCILSAPLAVIPTAESGRHFAHAFPQAVMAALVGEDPAKWISGYLGTSDWIRKWVKEEVTAPPEKDVSRPEDEYYERDYNSKKAAEIANPRLGRQKGYYDKR